MVSCLSAVADGVAVVLDAQPEMVRATAATAPRTASERIERFIVILLVFVFWLCPEEWRIADFL
jgi:hypothetical protein